MRGELISAAPPLPPADSQKGDFEGLADGGRTGLVVSQHGDQVVD